MRSVPVTTLAALCERYVDQPIDFLKVDVEGHEREVLEGSDWSRWRPRVVLIEGLDPSPWEHLVLGSGYLFATFDGINHFYVRDEDRAAAGDERPGQLDRRLRAVRTYQLVESLREQLASAQAALSDLQSRHEVLSACLNGRRRGTSRAWPRRSGTGCAGRLNEEGPGVSDDTGSLANSSTSDLGRDDERCAVLAGQHGVGLGVVDERLGRGVDVQLAAEPVGDVAEVAVGAGEVALLDVGVERLGVARLRTAWRKLAKWSPPPLPPGPFSSFGPR